MSEEMTEEERLAEEERLEKLWERLTITNDFIFSKAMSDKSLCTEVAETLLGFELGEITEPQREKSFKMNLESKGIRLDVYFKDSDHVVNIEIQTSEHTKLSKRSRYYQGVMDLDNLESGETYKELPVSYVIFICTADPFGDGLPCYTFKYQCQENNRLLEDGTHKLFFNVKAYDKAKTEKLQTLLKYFNGEFTEDDLVQKLHKRVVDIKQNTEWRTEFMKLELDMQDRYEKGRQDREVEIAKELFGRMDLSEIATVTGLPLDQVEAIHAHP